MSITKSYYKIRNLANMYTAVAAAYWCRAGTRCDTSRVDTSTAALTRSLSAQRATANNGGACGGVRG